MKQAGLRVLAILSGVIFNAGLVFAQATIVVEKENSTIHKIIDFLAQEAVKYGLKAIGAGIILFAAWFIGRLVASPIKNALDSKKIDISVTKFIIQFVQIVILALGALVALSTFGVQIAPLIAGLSVAGVGIGLALQGPLSNYAAGATLIFTKPFKVGDIVEVAGVQGEVIDVALPRTELIALDGVRVVVPNKHIIGEVMKITQYRRLEINVGVSYNGDVLKAIAIIEDIIAKDKRITLEKPSKVGIKEFGDSSINLQGFIWTLPAHFSDVRYGINQEIYKRFKAENIVIPFPQREVRILDGKT